MSPVVRLVLSPVLVVRLTMSQSFQSLGQSVPTTVYSLEIRQTCPSEVSLANFRILFLRLLAVEHDHPRFFSTSRFAVMTHQYFSKDFKVDPLRYREGSIRT